MRLATHFEKITYFEKKSQSAWNSGPSQRTLKTPPFFSKCVNIGHINTLSKKKLNQILYGLLYFSCLKILKTIINFENESTSSNILSTIWFIVRSLLRVILLQSDIAGIIFFKMSNFSKCVVKHASTESFNREKKTQFYINKGVKWMFLSFKNDD